MLRIAEISIHSCPIRSLGGKDTGGMNVYVRELSRELGQRGHRVDVFTRCHDPKEPEIMSLGENARLIHLAPGEQESITRQHIYHYLPQLLSNVHHFVESEEIRYDLLHSHYWLSARVAEQLKAQLGAPHVATFHTLGLVKNRARPAEQESELRIDAEREAIAAANRVIAFSTEEQEDLIHLYGAQREKVAVIPCGVKVDLFRPMDRVQARRELGLDQAKIVLFAGRIQPLKGIDILLKAVACLEDHSELCLLIVGGDAESVDEMARLGSLAAELGISQRVSFLGAVAHERMPLLYNAANVCVVPSYHESFCLVAIEALACGTPVVASRVGGLATTISDGQTGYLIPQLSAEAFAQRIQLLLGDEELERRLGTQGRNSVMKYSWSAIADQVLEVYQAMTGLA
jgi:D-inositol-3-phosphate glycosyltransferase